MKEITYDELNKLPKESYIFIDIRDEGLVSYGMIPGAVNIYIEDLKDSSKLAEIPKDKKHIFYCEIGRMSRDIDEEAEWVDISLDTWGNGTKQQKIQSDI